MKYKIGQKIIMKKEASRGFSITTKGRIGVIKDIRTNNMFNVSFSDSFIPERNGIFTISSDYFEPYPPIQKMLKELLEEGNNEKT